MLNWKICEGNTVEYLKKLRRKRYVKCLWQFFKKKKYFIFWLTIFILFAHFQLLLNNQLEMEKMKVEQEKKKCYLAQEALKEKVEEDCRIIFIQHFLIFNKNIYIDIDI